jgi:hypothetical protein
MAMPMVSTEHPALLKPVHGRTVDAPEPTSAFPVLACHRRLAVAAALFGSDAPPPRPNLAVTLAPLILAAAADWYVSSHARATEDRAKPATLASLSTRSLVLVPSLFPSPPCCLALALLWPRRAEP